MKATKLRLIQELENIYLGLKVKSARAVLIKIHPLKEGEHMSYMYERVSYLKGLAEGMEISESTKEGKLLLNIISILEEFAEEMEEVYEELDEVNETLMELDDYIEAVDEDLADLEEDIYELEDDYEEIECPDCGEMIFVDGQLIDKSEEVVCPNCGLIIEFSDECECCGDEDCSCCSDDEK